MHKKAQYFCLQFLTFKFINVVKQDVAPGTPADTEIRKTKIRRDEVLEGSSLGNAFEGVKSTIGHDVESSDHDVESSSHDVKSSDHDIESSDHDVETGDKSTGTLMHDTQKSKTSSAQVR